MITIFRRAFTPGNEENRVIKIAYDGLNRDQNGDGDGGGGAPSPGRLQGDAAHEIISLHATRQQSV